MDVTRNPIKAYIRLRNVTHAHVCVYQTVRDLIKADYEVHLVVDAVSSRSPQNKEIAVRRMERMGAHLTTTEMALFELKFDCTGETFRKLSKLVK